MQSDREQKGNISAGAKEHNDDDDDDDDEGYEQNQDKRRWVKR